MTTLVLVATVAITMYIPHGPVTFCGMLVVDIDGPFLALPVSQYSITWECGDRIGIKIGDELYFFDALDAGPFGCFCVRQLDGTCPPIAADLPMMHAPFDGLSTVADKVWNLEPIRREWAKHR